MIITGNGSERVLKPGEYMIKGLGLPTKAGGIGDLIISCDIEFPDKVNMSDPLSHTALNEILDRGTTEDSEEYKDSTYIALKSMIYNDNIKGSEGESARSPPEGFNGLPEGVNPGCVHQ
jgi:hypothetical protein